MTEPRVYEIDVCKHCGGRDYDGMVDCSCDSESTTVDTIETVPKADYDKLLWKYNVLLPFVENATPMRSDEDIGT